MNATRQAGHGRGMRWFIVGIVVAVAWVPGAVALAMLISGNAG